MLETNSLMSLLKYIKEGDVFVIDLDNTTIRSAQQLGSIQWSDYLGREYAKLGDEKSYEELDRFVSHYWSNVQPQIRVCCVDPQTPELFKKLNELGIKVLGLTARRPNEIDYTLKQLESVNIDLSRQALSDSRLEIPFEGKEPALYEKGILFCTPLHEKSEVLEVFFKDIGYIPNMIYADDKSHHVNDLEKFAKKHGVRYQGFRFSGADQFVASFDPDVASLQYEALPYLISDKEAAVMLKARNLLLNYGSLISSYVGCLKPFHETYQFFD